MIMSDLTLDLIEEILCRIPATSLKQLRSTCKIWNALFKDQRFTKNHFCKAPRQSHVLMSSLVDYNKLYPVKVDLNVVPPSIEFKDELSPSDPHSNNSEQVGNFIVSHCDGLLLCTTKDKGLVVWNPCLGETRWIQTKADDKSYYPMSRFALGYQNKKSFRSYTILRCWRGSDRVVEFGIYELSTDLWRVFDDVALNCFILPCADVSLKGNPYWLAYDFTSTRKFVLGFDLTRGRIIRLCLPSFLNRGHGNIHISVIREEQLSFLHWNRCASKMEIWVPSEINTEVALWSRYLTLELNTRSQEFPIPFYFASFLINEEKKVALCCNARFGYVKKFKLVLYVIGEDNEHSSEMPSNINKLVARPNIFNYIPSLVQIPQGGAK